MKRLFYGLMLLSSFSAFALGEQSMRITNENIESLEVINSVCSDYIEPAKLIVTLKNKSDLIFTMSSGWSGCQMQSEDMDEKARKLGNKIASIQAGDVEAYQIGDNVVCVKNVGYALWNNVSKLAYSFESKQVTVACPK